MAATLRSTTTGLAALAVLVGCSPRNPLPVVEEQRPTYGENGWPSVLPDYDEYEGDGANEGDFLWDVELADQNNNATQLKQFLGHVLIVDASTEWCGPCREAAAASMQTIEEMRHIGPSYIVTLIVQDEFGQFATVETAERWVEDFGIEGYPVLVDDNERVRNAWEVTGFPTFWFVAPNGLIVRRMNQKPTESEVLDFVEQAVEEWGHLLRHIEDEPDPEGDSTE